MELTRKLLDLQERINEYYAEEWEDYLECIPHISFSNVCGLYNITFYGEGHDQSNVKVEELEEGANFAFAAFLELLTKNPSEILSLEFNGPDEGANGTRNWDFSRLIKSDAVFENLKVFKVALTDPGDHNTSVIGEYYDEEGMIAKLVSKMPVLEQLQVPSAPDKSFFELGNLSLKQLTVQAGYDPQDFIRNLAASTHLKNLRSLDYTDITWQEETTTSFEDYKRLFESGVLNNYEYFHFKLRDFRLSVNQLEELQQIKKVQLLYINTKQGEYICVPISN